MMPRKQTIGSIGFIVCVVGFASLVPAGILHFAALDPHDIALIAAGGLLAIGGVLFGVGIEEAAKAPWSRRPMTPRERALMPKRTNPPHGK
jgi:hypothetical protein